MPEFIRVAGLADIPDRRGLRVNAGRHQIALFKLGEKVYAINDRCTHADASLAEGELMGEEVTCPLHFACFNVRTGSCTGPPAEEDVHTYETRVVDGHVEVKV